MKKSNKGHKFETRIQKTIGSGNLWFDSGDLKDRENKIECKYTDKKGFRLTLNMLEKIWGEALSVQKLPRFIIGIKRNENEVFVIKSIIEIERKII
jgi:hypothetical protein